MAEVEVTVAAVVTVAVAEDQAAEVEDVNYQFNYYF
jgi:hypothetical protein